MPLVAGVDSSTQSTKVELRDATSGELAGSGRSPHRAVTPPVAEQDPADWWRAFETAWGQALDEAGRRADDIAAISVAGQQHGLVCLDADDRVIRPAKLWCDTTSAADADWLIDQLPAGAAGWAQACGSVPVAAFTIAKLSWLHRTEPDAWERLARVALPHDWLTLQLTGRLVTDRGDVSGTGYWSPVDGRYRWDLLAILDGDRDWGAALPEVLGPIDPAGRWHNTVVGPGTGDNMAAALGIGLLEGDIAVSLGSSGTVFGVSPTPTADPTGAVAGFADATGRFLPLVCTLNATKVTGAIGRLLGLDHDAFDAAAMSASAAPEESRCCRTSTASARPTVLMTPAWSAACAPTSDRRSWHGPRSKASSADCSTDSTRWSATRRSTVDCTLSAAAPGRPRTVRCWPTSRGDRSSRRT